MLLSNEVRYARRYSWPCRPISTGELSWVLSEKGQRTSRWALLVLSLDLNICQPKAEHCQSEKTLHNKHFWLARLWCWLILDHPGLKQFSRVRMKKTIPRPPNICCTLENCPEVRASSVRRKQIGICKFHYKASILVYSVTYDFSKWRDPRRVKREVVS